MSRGARLFILLSAAIPLVFTVAGIDPAFSVRAILLTLLTIGGLWAVRRNRIQPSISFLCWSLYALATLASIGWATNFGEAVYAASMVLLYFGFFVAAREIVTVDAILPIAKVFSSFALLLSVVALVQFYDLGFRWIPGGALPYGTMTTKNMLSSFLFLLLPFVAFIALTGTGRWRWFGLTSWTSVILTLLIAQTRSVWLGTIAMSAVTATAIFASRKRDAVLTPLASRILSMGLLAAICAGYVFAFRISPRAVTDPRTPGWQVARTFSYQPADTSATMRLTVWKQSVTMFREHPWGVGAGNWKIELPRYGLMGFPIYVQNGSYQWTHPHNDFIAVLCETGIPGLLGYAGIFAVALWIALRSARRQRPRLAATTNEKLFAAQLAGCIVGFAVISFFDFPKERVEHMMMFAIILALIDKIGLTAGMPEGNRKRFNIHPFAGIVLSLPALGLATLHFLAERHEHNFIILRQEEDWPAVLEECNKTYDPKLLTLDELSTPVMYYKAEAEFMQNDFQSALRDNLEALKAHPNHFYTLNNTGSCYVKLGNFQAAEVFYKRALAISPKFEESLLNLTAVYFNQKSYAKALETVSRCDTSIARSRAQDFARAVRARIQ